MPVSKRAPKFKAPRRRRRVARVPRSVRSYNPRPVFTETCRVNIIDTAPAMPYQLRSNQLGQIRFQMDMLPQLAQYSALYQKYRILKVQYLMLGTYNTQASDLNSAQSNVASNVSYGMGRIAHVIQSSPSVPLPTTEDDVLTCNGAKIITGKPKFTITHRPVPDLLDANGNRLSMKSPFLQFETSGFNIPHGAVNWSYILPGANQVFDPFYAVYAKVTFQLSDPR